MRALHTLILWPAALFLLSGCEEVVDIELRGTAPQYVIEGMVTDQFAPAEVRISTTLDFYEETRFGGVSDALVLLSDNAGNETWLNEVSPGIYRSGPMAGVPGRTYHLEVKIGNANYTSVSTMPHKVAFDSIYLATERFPSQDYLTPYAQFRDPAGIINFYRFRLFVNDEFQKLIDIENDEFTDGLLVRRGVYYFGSTENDDPADDDGLKTGDKVRLEMQCIDKPVFRYFYTLSNVLSGDAEPANPETNITGGALGYFSAYTVESREIVVEEEE